MRIGNHAVKFGGITGVKTGAISGEKYPIFYWVQKGIHQNGQSEKGQWIHFSRRQTFDKHEFKIASPLGFVIGLFF